VADKGIIFSAPMVRALLAGRKTQTRRLLTSARVFATPESPAFTLKGEHLKRALQGADRWRHLGETGWCWEADAFDYQAPATRTGWMAHLPYAPGDRLYVREAYAIRGVYSDVVEVGYRAHERASHTEFVEQWPAETAVNADGTRPRVTWPSYKPSIHMPRWASRLTLTVTDVRVQRVAEISEADARAEGLIPWSEGVCHPTRYSIINDPAETWETARDAFAGLWSQLHDKTGERWEDNPWIVAVSFDVKQGNIDRISA